MELIPLSVISIGQSFTVRKILTVGAMRRRLQDMGLIEGARVSCQLKSLSRDPCAYLISGALIALRQEDSSKILGELN